MPFWALNRQGIGRGMSVTIDMVIFVVAAIAGTAFYDVTKIIFGIYLFK